MVGLRILQKATGLVATPSSDYGSDLDDDTANELLSQVEYLIQPTVLLNEELQQDPVVQDAPPALQRTVLLKRSVEQSEGDLTTFVPNESLRGPKIEVEYSEANRSTFSRMCVLTPALSLQADEADIQRSAAEPSTNETSASPARDETSTAPEQPGEDPRAPIERFRAKKPLSVTDLVSPAWCEQQYWYSLTRFGRVRRTKAMKQGSSVHKVLEEQVHKEVKIDVQTREDMFGLRIWNVIQGLRTLRATGMTREMEVWGVLNGEMVNGIIDEINMVCPDEEAEQAMLQKEEAAKDGVHKSKPLEAGQKTLAGFLKDSKNAQILEQHFRSAPSSSHDEAARTYYLSDVKTRQSKSLPPNGSPSKPVYMQLMLYRRLFASLAANETPADKVFERYKLDPHATFSDTFIAEMSQLDFNSIDTDSSPDDERRILFESKPDAVTDLLAHNSLSSLWSFMIAEFARTIPIPIPPSPNVRSSISKLVVAEYRSGGTGALIGKKAFVHDDVVLDDYANDEIRWWRGERATKGVDIEDASKCRICEFAEGCSWRQEKLEEATKKARLRKGPRKSEV